MKHAVRGYTLIELMIVVVIIGILAAMATAAYQGYIARARFTVLYAELAASKTNYETLLAVGDSPDNPEVIGLRSSHPSCERLSVAAPMGKAPGIIACERIKNQGFLLNGKDLTLVRPQDGQWQCKTSVSDTYVPSFCRQRAG